MHCLMQPSTPLKEYALCGVGAVPVSSADEMRDDLVLQAREPGFCLLRIGFCGASAGLGIAGSCLSGFEALLQCAHLFGRTFSQRLAASLRLESALLNEAHCLGG